MRERIYLNNGWKFSESFEEGALGSAIMNRMLKAAGHKIIKTE